MKEQIQQKALELGFDVCRFGTAVDRSAELTEWLKNGYHGEMQWMQDRAEIRANGKVMMPNMESTVIVGLNYGDSSNPLVNTTNLQAENKKQNPNNTNSDNGYISIYARNNDYHDILKKKLKHLARYIVDNFGGELKVFVDTAPVMEKPLAQQAGLGWQGKHTCIVSREFGSWLFLGVIYTTLKIEADMPEVDHCGRCDKCQTACPTKAFVKPRVLDARKCISYLTIEHKGIIEDSLKEAMGNRIYGCDDCLAACPWNKFAKTSNEIKFHAREELKKPKLSDLSKLDDTSFREMFSKSPIKRIGVNRFLRNVMIAMGNSKNKDFLKDIEPFLNHENEALQNSAIWAKNKLLNNY